MPSNDTKRFHRLAAVIGLAIFVAICGCSDGPKLRPNRAIVTGTVTYQGKPLPGGYVFFTSVKDPIYNSDGSIGEDGAFVVGDAPLGPVRVTIDTAAMKIGMPERYVEIPAKYAAPNHSGLTYDVKPGENSGVNFDLQ